MKCNLHQVNLESLCDYKASVKTGVIIIMSNYWAIYYHVKIIRNSNIEVAMTKFQGTNFFKNLSYYQNVTQKIKTAL